MINIWRCVLLTNRIIKREGILIFDIHKVSISAAGYVKSVSGKWSMSLLYRYVVLTAFGLSTD